MFDFTPKTYKSTPLDLLHFISLLDLWTIPRFSPSHQEIVVATTVYTGVVESARPMATIYIAEKEGHQPLTGTIVLIDETSPTEREGDIELRLEGRPYHEFKPNASWNPIIDNHYRVQDRTALVREVRELIADHLATNWFNSVPHDRR